MSLYEQPGLRENVSSEREKAGCENAKCWNMASEHAQTHRNKTAENPTFT